VLCERAPATQTRAADSKIFEITRDYTMYDRAEAPQQYPPMQRR
jgi:hypothetical protein